MKKTFLNSYLESSKEIWGRKSKDEWPSYIDDSSAGSATHSDLSRTVTQPNYSSSAKSWVHLTYGQLWLRFNSAQAYLSSFDNSAKQDQQAQLDRTLCIQEDAGFLHPRADVTR